MFEKILLALIFLIVVFCCTFEMIVPQKTWKVEVTYCDSRPKKIVYKKHFQEPNKGDISYYQQAVPTWDNEINVCDIKVIGISTHTKE